VLAATKQPEEHDPCGAHHVRVTEFGNLHRPATKEGVREGDVIAGGDVERENLEREACCCHLKEGGQLSR
jgi:hypothetical protein